MEGWWRCRRRMCFSWCKTSSSSRLLGFMVPLVMLIIVISGVIAFGGIKGSNRMAASNFHTWLSPSVAVDGTKSSKVIEDPMSLSPPKYSGVGAQFHPELQPSGSGMVGGGGISEEAPSVHFIVNRRSAAPPPLAIEHIQITEKSVGQEEEILNITTNRTQLYPSFNETHAIPRRARINRRHNHLDKMEAEMQKARTIIRGSIYSNQSYDPDYIPTGPMYWNANSFHRSYLEMEKLLKIYVYEEGEPPIFHNGPCKSIYAMEGNFIYYMEASKFRTKDPDKAHIFFLPISVTTIVHFIYDEKSKDHKKPLKRTVRDYVNLVAGKYPYWNRSLGADHFILACHDWGPELSKSVPELYKNSIRCLCNANTSEGFNPSKDVSFPEVHLPGGTINGLIGGPSPSKRPILAFFAGGLHGPIRPILLEHWENKDEDIQVQRYLPKGVSYYGMMKKSKYCICPSCYEVASPRIVEALYTGCVPVIIKDHYVAPFSDVLNWEAFSVDIPVKDIPNLKRILTGISTRQYIRMQRRGKKVRRHFEVSFPPKRYDVFHMILHSVWLRRLNIRLPVVFTSSKWPSETTSEYLDTHSLKLPANGSVQTSTTNVGSHQEPEKDIKVPLREPGSKRKNGNLEVLESGLRQARAEIIEAKYRDDAAQDSNFVPKGPMYLNATAFHRSYLEMEKRFKVFVYEEGEPPVFHYGPCKQTYAIEGYFIQAIEVSPFRTVDPSKAHVYFLPFSVAMLTQVVYVPGSHQWTLMKNTALDYVNVIANKYPYWNRSLGADHFMLACHDWGPEISFAIPYLYQNSIRALCNANTSEKFNPSKDVSIPEIHLPWGTTEGLLGGPSPSKRPVLVFYAGGIHGPIRPILLQHWENKDEDVQVHQYLPKGVSYYGMMRKSRYCICPSGYEVASPRMVEALYMGCVPVLIKDGYVIPFSDVLNWKTFSVIIPVKEIPNLKKILMDISQRQYIKMQRRGLQMRRHFEVNSPPKPYDVFHMILHSIWLRRLNLRVYDANES